MMYFVGKDEMGRNVYHFDCPRCQATGELGIPEDQRFVDHHCGVVFKQSINRHNGHTLQAFIGDVAKIVLDKHFGKD